MRHAFLLALVACGGEPAPALEESFAKAGSTRCDDLDAFASDVEAYVRAYEEALPTSTIDAEALTARREAIRAKGAEIASREGFTSPACKARYEQVSARMAAAAERARVRSAEIEARAKQP